MAGRREIDVIDIDHDASDYASDGGDYIKLLDWLEETGRNYPIRIHSMNVSVMVGRKCFDVLHKRLEIDNISRYGYSSMEW